MENKSDPLFLVIDQGGHASRALVFDQHGQIISSATADIETIRRGDNEVEHDPEELIDSIAGVIDDAMAELRGRAGGISSVGFATQRSSVVCWNKITGAALSPVISWQDRRAANWLGQFRDQERLVHELTGLVLSAHYGASKLRWCLDQLPAVREARDAGRLACGPLASFILFRLLRDRPMLVDPANASRTLLWDFRKRDWSAPLLELFGVPGTLLPRCVPSRHPYGKLHTPAGALPVDICTGDQSAALFAFGEPQRDTIYINAGTGAFLQRNVGAEPIGTARLLSSVVWQSGLDAMYVLEGTVNGAASALRQVGAELGIKLEELDAMVSDSLASVDEPPLFLNGVSGLGSPFWRADFQSRFVGTGTVMEKLAAVTESIVFLIQANLEEMIECAGAAKRIVISGGLATPDGLCQRLADLSQLPVERPAVQEATARGLAWLLAGRPPAWLTSTPVNRFTPESNPALIKRYEGWRKEMN